MPRQKSTLGGILNFSGNRPKVVGNGPDGGKLGLGCVLRMLRIPKSVGSGTLRALYGGLRAQNRKLANRCDGPTISKIENLFGENLKNQFWGLMFWEMFGPKKNHRSKCFATVLIDKIIVCLRVFVTELEIAASVRNTARGTRSRSAKRRTKFPVFFLKNLRIAKLPGNRFKNLLTYSR